MQIKTDYSEVKWKENGKLKLENCLTDHVHIHKPGVIINYKNDSSASQTRLPSCK